MPKLKFFEQPILTGEALFQEKLRIAISLIKANQSVVAKKVLEVVDAHKLIIHSFFNMSKDNYLDMKQDMLKEHRIQLPPDFPPKPLAVRKIESKFEGIIYNSKHIYINSQRSPKEIAVILVHEIGHFLNAGIAEKERTLYDDKRAAYDDEIRSFTAEKIFERDGHCLRRSDIKAIHDNVSKLYPEFLGAKKEAPTAGYLYASYDEPDEEMGSSMSMKM